MVKIKMRISKDECCRCISCGNSREQSLEMFELKIGAFTFFLCDSCNEVILQKALKANCLVNGKLKTKNDLKVIRKRRIALQEEEGLT